jgi:hypothetical protein
MTSLDSVLLGILESDIPQVMMYSEYSVIFINITLSGAGD